MNPMDLKRGIDAAVKVVLEELETISKPISKPSEIQQALRRAILSLVWP